MRQGLPRLFWISPGEGLGDPLERRLMRCVAAGLSGFQLREKASFPRDLVAAVNRCREALPSDRGLVLVNDRVDVALASSADGVHLGQASLSAKVARHLLGPDATIGVSAHDEAQLAEAEAGAADFAFVSPVYPLARHARHKAPPIGPLGLERLVRSTRLPVYALGGLLPERVGEVLGCGAVGIAVLGSIARASDPAAVVAAYLEALA